MNNDVFDLIEEYAQGSDHPDLKIYRRDLEDANPLHKDRFDRRAWVQRRAYYCRAGHFQKSRILEVGCGFGWDAVAISVLGDNQVVASDILPSMIAGVEECLAAMRKKGKTINIEPKVVDICNNDLPSESFDGIYSSEAIEHVHDLDEMFDQCYRLLKPGKRLLIANDSNRLNPQFREDMFKMWAERDTSWRHAEWLKTEIRPIEHQNARPYAVMRAEFVKRAAPDIEEADLNRLTQATAGMIGPEIERATFAYRQSGTLPTPPTYSWCRNPETGEYAERLLDPFELKAMLDRRGFKTTVGHGFSKFPLTLLNDFHSHALSAQVFKWRRLFILCAEKIAK